MPLCKNCDCYYTGKENTPRGLGWCARHEEEGKRRKGSDDRWYKNDKGRWKKQLRKRLPLG